MPPYESHAARCRRAPRFRRFRVVLAFPSTDTSFRKGDHVQRRFSMTKIRTSAYAVHCRAPVDRKHPAGTRTYNDNGGRICWGIESLTGCQSRNGNLAVKREDDGTAVAPDHRSHRNSLRPLNPRGPCRVGLKKNIYVNVEPRYWPKDLRTWRFNRVFHRIIWFFNLFSPGYFTGGRYWIALSRFSGSAIIDGFLFEFLLWPCPMHVWKNIVGYIEIKGKLTGIL